MATLKDFQVKRPNRPMYETMTISHPTIGTLFLLANQIFAQTFEGVLYHPVRMVVADSQQSSTPVIDATITLGRLALDFKQALKQWRAFSRQDPITATYKRYDSADKNTPLKPWTLYVKSVSMDADDVTMVLSLKNPLTNNIATLYDTETFPGLQDV